MIERHPWVLTIFKSLGHYISSETLKDDTTKSELEVGSQLERECPC